MQITWLLCGHGLESNQGKFIFEFITYKVYKVYNFKVNIINNNNIRIFNTFTTDALSQLQYISSAVCSGAVTIYPRPLQVDL